MNIYIAVLYICLGDTCNFMQGQSYHKTEQQCRAAIDNQKAHLNQIAQDANQSKMTVLEGTCISFVAKPPSKTI
jgi:hypothetical protein